MSKFFYRFVFKTLRSVTETLQIYNQQNVDVYVCYVNDCAC